MLKPVETKIVVHPVASNIRIAASFAAGKRGKYSYTAVLTVESAQSYEEGVRVQRLIQTDDMTELRDFMVLVGFNLNDMPSPQDFGYQLNPETREWEEFTAPVQEEMKF